MDGNATAAVLDDGRRMTAYLDYAATTPVDARVAARLAECLTVEGNFGNPGSSSHDFGDAASGLVATARAQVAAAVGAATLIAAQPASAQYGMDKNSGKNVSITPTVQAMPIAHTGPRLRSELSSLKVRQSSARMTVNAEAAMAGAAPRHAAIMASLRRSKEWSSSRYRLIKRRA